MCFRTIFRHHDQPQSVKRRGQSGPQSLMKPVTALNESVTLSPPQTRQTSAAGPRQYVTQRTTHCHRRRVIRHQRRDDVSDVITNCFYAPLAVLCRNWRRAYTIRSIVPAAQSLHRSAYKRLEFNENTPSSDRLTGIIRRNRALYSV